MASVLLSSVGIGQQFFDNNGVPLAGGLIYTYQAGSSTPLVTYTDNGGTTANANPIVLDSSGRVPNEIWLLNGYSYKFIITSASGTSLITLDNLYGILQTAPAVTNTVPSGLIAIWSGSTGSIPSGWLLCNGSNGTPDLRNSFILGAGNAYAVGATGGSTDAIVVSHTHSITDPGHIHTQGAVRADSMNVAGGSFDRMSSSSTASAVTGISINTAGVSGSGANMPPYYALAFIMKS
jgi:microcystin-dependent protein